MKKRIQFFILDNNKTIKLSNVLTGGDAAYNLISLRRFAHPGFGMYHDDNVLQIFDKNNGEVHLSGIHKNRPG